ncbi:hypothetical protein HID58_042801 [Brassica napus]|uniref:Uncharacterized protein n=1 Tax=Brassica napus TaxID=3708 RepID=A0ABQ8BEX5_BRANA|nr:hypothetical protein HID58_042801 [Brassica napus]
MTKEVDGMQSQITEMNRNREATEENPNISSEVQSLKEKLDEHSKQLEQNAEKLSQLQSENTVLRDQNQARSMVGNKKRRFNTQDADPESREGPPKDRYRPLRMVSLKVLQSGTCSEDRDLARSSSSTPHGSRQIPTDGLATKEVGHKQREETSSEIIPDGSGAEGTLPTENKDT